MLVRCSHRCIGCWLTLRSKKWIISSQQELVDQSFVYDQEQVTKRRQFEEILEGEMVAKEEKIKSLSAQVQNSQAYFDYQCQIRYENSIPSLNSTLPIILKNPINKGVPKSNFSNFKQGEPLQPTIFESPSFKNLVSTQEPILKQAQPVEEPREFTFPSFRSFPFVQEPFIEQRNPCEEPIREAQPTPYVPKKPKEEMLVEEETNILAYVMFERELGNDKSNVIMEENEAVDEEQTLGPHNSLNIEENRSVNLLHLAMEEYKLQCKKLNMRRFLRMCVAMS